MNVLNSCKICPRECGADRLSGKTGFCAQTNEIKIARASLHMWEEPCISGTNGSGTVFFSGCSLGCIYCQNSLIAHKGNGGIVTDDELCNIFLMLQDKGAHNINLVTPTHFSVQLVKILEKVKPKLNIPIIYNCGGYELVKTLKMLDGLIDIYLPDYKYTNPETAKKYSNAPDYPEIAKEAVAEMFRQKPKQTFSKNKIMQSGVIIRHMLLPGSLKNSKDTVKYLFSEYSDNITLSIMNQYTPIIQSDVYPELNMSPSKREYEKLVDYTISLGVKNAYVQDCGSASEIFVPDFGKNSVLLDF